jgi:hypothetical protein
VARGQRFFEGRDALLSPAIEHWCRGAAMLAAEAHQEVAQ